MLEENRFQQQKKVALERLEKDRKGEKVDKALFSLLKFINSLKGFYSTSSCAGRIALFHDQGSKLKSDFLGKWHHQINVEEVKETLKKSPQNGRIWFKYEPSILHIVTRDFDKSKELLVLALSSGYKRSGIHGCKEERYLIEICDTGKIDVPILEKGKLLISNAYLRYLTTRVNKKFQKDRRRLRDFEQILREKLK